MPSDLRPYQTESIRLIGKEVAAGNRAVLLVIPTGTGKTSVCAEICRRHLEKIPQGKVLWLAHREELVGQAFDELASLGLSCGVIQSTPCRVSNSNRRVQVASIQTLLARKQHLEGITLVVHDEAHTSPARLWSTVPQYYKSLGAILIGPTATPVRADGLGLGEIYDAIVNPLTTAQAIDQGYLTPFEIVGPPRALTPKQIAQNPVKAYLEHARGRRTAVFAPHVKAAEEYLAEFRAAGITAELVTGETDSADRRGSLERYRQGETEVLVNVGVLTTGWDDPPTSCIILARAIGSVGLYLQIVGRGLRLSPGKENCLILDLHGSSHIHGAPDEERIYSLEGDGITRKNVAPCKERFCAVCGIKLGPEEFVCEFCGIARPEQAAAEVMNIKLVKFAGKRQEDPAKRIHTLCRWLQECRVKGWKYGRAFHRYSAVYGCYPSSEITNAAYAGLT